MKKFMALIAMFSICLTDVQAAVMKFSDAYAQCDRKPMLVMIYAKWANGYQNALNEFRKVQQQFGDTFNYVELDIATPDTAAYNEHFAITQNLPYVMLYRNGGKIARYIEKGCANSSSCMIPKVKSFIIK